MDVKVRMGQVHLLPAELAIGSASQAMSCSAP
jgi:hypothetical protein